MKTKITLVQYKGQTDIHIGYNISDKVFLYEKPTLVTKFEVDNVFLRLTNEENEIK